MIVVGKLAVNATPIFELHDLNNSKRMNVSLDILFNFFNKTTSDEEIIREATVA